VILTWVISLLLLCTSLIVYLESLTALRIFEVNTIELAQKNFIAAEKVVIDCEKHLLNISVLTDHPCFIEPLGKNRWRISSKQKPSIQVHVSINEKTNEITRLNWRQVFE
jgi:hypothetical protein